MKTKHKKILDQIIDEHYDELFELKLSSKQYAFNVAKDYGDEIGYIYTIKSMKVIFVILILLILLFFAMLGQYKTRLELKKEYQKEIRLEDPIIE